MGQKNKYTNKQLLKMLKGKPSASQTAFTYIYDTHSARIYAYCLRMSGNEEDANDIFQDAFYKFFESVKKINHVENIPGFLITIARNVWLNHQRAQKMKFTSNEFDLSEFDRGYEKKELLDLIRESVEQLDPRYKEIFILRQYQGLTYQEISEITGMSPSLAKNKFWRAKERIKKILSPYLIDLESNS
jgi:RNA polymerase sigma-70 factor, ECF subfamily